jgi:alpha-N-arabinofuranosidase
MVLTPTYHVFDLYQAHMNGSLLESHVFTDTVEDMPQVHASASRKDQVITVTLSNLSADTPAETTLDLFGACAASACARVITGAPQAHNTFDAPETVKPQALSVNIADGRATVTLPPCSVAEVTLHV